MPTAAERAPPTPEAPRLHRRDYVDALLVVMAFVAMFWVSPLVSSRFEPPTVVSSRIPRLRLSNINNFTSLFEGYHPSNDEIAAFDRQVMKEEMVRTRSNGTQLALFYANHSDAIERYDIVWVIDDSTEVRLERWLTMLAHALLVDTKVAKNMHDLMIVVTHRLMHGRRSWLLVLLNIPSARPRPSTPAVSGFGHIIVTEREDVPPVSVDNEFLSEFSSHCNDTSTCALLRRILGPRSISWDHTQLLLDDRNYTLFRVLADINFARHIAPNVLMLDNQSEPHITTTVTASLALKALARPCAKHVSAIAMLSILNPANLTRALLHAVGFVPSGDCFLSLLQYKLIETGTPAPSTWISMPAPVAAAARARLNDTTLISACAAAAEVLAGGIEADFPTFSRIPDILGYAIHVDPIKDTCLVPLASHKSRNMDVAYFTFKAARFHLFTGNYSACVSLIDFVINDVYKLTKPDHEHADKFRVRAECLMRSSNITAAVDAFAILEPVMAIEIGRRDVIMTTIHLIARFRLLMGRYHDALRLLDGMKYPDISRDLLSPRSCDLASAHLGLHNISEALLIADEGLLEFAKAHYTDRDRAACQLVRARILHTMGNYTEAVASVKVALRLFKKFYQRSHPTPALARCQLVHMAGPAGLPKVPTDVNSSLALLTQLFGPNHLDVSYCTYVAALCAQSRGQFDAALVLFTEALRVRELVLGREHVDVAQTLDGMAGVLASLARHHEGIAARTRAVAIYRAVLGNRHPVTLTTWIALARAHQHAYQTAVANEMLLAMEPHANATDPALLLAVIASQADILTMQGRFTSAAELYDTRVLPLARRLQNHAMLIETLDELGKSHREHGNHAKAAVYFAELAQLYASLGSDEMEYMLTLDNLLHSYEALGQHFQSVDVIEKLGAAAQGLFQTLSRQIDAHSALPFEEQASPQGQAKLAELRDKTTLISEVLHRMFHRTNALRDLASNVLN